MGEAVRAGGRSVAAALAGHLEAAGFARCEPAILQPVADFADSGEDIRSRLYLTTDAAGQEFCLRPEYTIPVCRAYLDSAAAGTPMGFCYAGPVFRYRPGAAGEFIQAGLESFGRPDHAAADAEILARALDAVAAVGQPPLDVRIGDAGLFAGLLDALAIPPQWRRRITRGHLQGKSLDAILANIAGGPGGEHAGVLAALDGADKQGARALVEDLLSIAGIAAVGGRTAAEIADRFLEQAALKSGSGLPDEKRAAIAQFLAIAGDPDAAAQALRDLGTAAGFDLTDRLDAFEARLGFMATHGIDVGRLHFATEFTRNLDYYTGFVFEARDPTRPEAGPVIGGGRYDRLMRSLGAPGDIPAVGAAIWVERLAAAREGA